MEIKEKVKGITLCSRFRFSKRIISILRNGHRVAPPIPFPNFGDVHIITHISLTFSIFMRFLRVLLIRYFLRCTTAQSTSRIQSGAYVNSCIDMPSWMSFARSRKKIIDVRCIALYGWFSV
jgi:hypothetical protein